MSHDFLSLFDALRLSIPMTFIEFRSLFDVSVLEVPMTFIESRSLFDVLVLSIPMTFIGFRLLFDVLLHDFPMTFNHFCWMLFTPPMDHVQGGALGLDLRCHPELPAVVPASHGGGSGALHLSPRWPEKTWKKNIEKRKVIYKGWDFHVFCSHLLYIYYDLILQF